MLQTLTRLVVGLLCLAPISVFSQNSITTGIIAGTIFDQDEAPVAFANVILNSAQDSSLVKVEYSDDNGAFRLANIEEGRYILEITYVGMPPYRTDVFELFPGQELEMGSIVMKAASTELEEVVVTAERPLLEIQPDKMVFNVENSINATGNTAMELLRKSPGVVVDNNDNITMLGRSGVRIYIDGKPSPLRGEDLANYLKTLQSTDIDAIEIITNPGAKYEAEGNGGIINIRLKKDMTLGANANVNLGYTVGEMARYNGGLTANYRNRKFNLFGNYSYNDGRNPQFMNLYREQLGLRFDQRGNNLADWQAHNFKLGSDFFLSDKNTIGFMIDGNVGDNVWTSRSRTEIGMVGESTVDSILIAESVHNGNRSNLNYNLNYRFDNGEGQTLNIDADMGQFRNQGDADQPNFYVDPTEEIVLADRSTANKTATDINIYTFKTDYEQPFLKGMLGAGLKFSYVQTDNSFEFFNIADGAPVFNPDRSNDFEYIENVNAAYLNYSYQLKKFSFTAGLRAEQTNSRGELTASKTTEDDLVKRNYLDFFPTAAVSYNVSEKHSFRLAYGRRINRPSYQDLNPFQFQLDELTYEQGNPFLRPEYTQNVQFSHTFAQRLNTTLSYSHTTDLITRQTDTSGTTASYITWLNLDDQYNYSLNVSAPFPLAKWWNTYTSLTGYYTRNKGDFGEGKVIDVDAKSFNIYMQHTFKLPKDFSFEVSGWYNSPSLWGGNFQMDAMWSMDAGIQKKIFDGRGNLKLSVSDIFKTNQWYGESQFGALYLKVNGGFDSRRLRLNFSYLIGNSQVKSTRRRKTGLEDEQSRIKS